MTTKSRATSPLQAEQATCPCGSGIPVQIVEVAGESVMLIALPIFFERLLQANKTPQKDTITELLEQVQLYNPIPLGEEAAYRDALMREYTAFYDAQGSAR